VRNGGTVRRRIREDAASAGAEGGEKHPVSNRAYPQSGHSTHGFRLFRGSMTPPRDENSRINTTPNFHLISPGFTCFQLVSPNFTSRPQGGVMPPNSISRQHRQGSPKSSSGFAPIGGNSRIPPILHSAFCILHFLHHSITPFFCSGKGGGSFVWPAARKKSTFASV
jgi:hypothetical protein